MHIVDLLPYQVTLSIGLYHDELGHLLWVRAYIPNNLLFVFVAELWIPCQINVIGEGFGLALMV
jgi:hypothetical protein